MRISKSWVESNADDANLQKLIRISKSCSISKCQFPKLCPSPKTPSPGQRFKINFMPCQDKDSFLPGQRFILNKVSTWDKDSFWWDKDSFSMGQRFKANESLSGQRFIFFNLCYDKDSKKNESLSLHSHIGRSSCRVRKMWFSRLQIV